MCVICDKDFIKTEWQNGAQTQRKHIQGRQTLYSNLNERIWEWFCVARSNNIPVSRKLLQEKALLISLELGHDTFTT